MKILQINKFLYPQGGAETYFLGLSKLLTQNGQDVIYFSQKNPKNISLANEELFVSGIDLEKFSLKALLSLGRIFWSFEAARKIKQLIEIQKPDIVHIHNIYHQISPSILKAIKKYKLPIVMTVHDFKLIKPDYSLRADNKKTFHKNSIAIHAILALEFYFHKLIGVYKKNIDLFLVSSEFLKDKLVENGFDKDKIVINPLFIDLENYKFSQTELESRYLLYFGRLHEGKGIDTLIKAVATTNLKLKIAGDGPEKETLIKLAKELKADSRIEFLGNKSKDELIGLIGKSLFTIMPSRIHETFGLSALESFACGKAVIATRAGALTELVGEKNGLLFDVDNVSQLRENINFLAANNQALELLSKNAHEFSQKFAPAIHYQKIMEIYKTAINHNGKR